MKNLFSFRCFGAVSICALLLAVCLTVGVSWAYFADSVSLTKDYDVAVMSSQVYESTLGSGSVSIGSQYTSQTTISAGASKTLTLKNTSNLKTTNALANKVLLRVSFSVKVGTSNTNTTNYAYTLVDSSVYTTVAGQTNAGFTDLENGWFYYNAPLLKDQYAPFATFSNTGTSAIHVQLTIEVVQASTDVAKNYWNYHSGYNDNILGSSTVDGVPLTGSNGIAVLVPNGTSGWRQATNTDSLDADYTSGESSATISLLSGGTNNSCLRVYNNCATPVILALRITIQLNKGGISVVSPDDSAFVDTVVKLNFANSSDESWIDIRDNYTALTFDKNLTQKYTALVYNKLVLPGESVYALDKTISVTPTEATGFSFHIVCEVMGYNASESSFVDKYLSVDGYTLEESSGDDNGLTVGVDRVPLFYDYSSTDNTNPLYSSQLSSNGEFVKYNQSANFYSQYAIWYNLILPKLSS